jgi:hypothetical protein
MKLIARYMLVLFAGLILSSCVTTINVPIEQMEPGKVILPAQIRKVALISRNFKFSIDTLTGYFKDEFRLRKGARVDNQQIDSIAVTKSLDNLRKALLESGRCDEVYVYPSNAIKAHVGEKEQPLSSSFIQSVCAESQTDAVISLEMLSSFYSRHLGSGREIQAEANVKVTAIWAVYTPKNDGPVDRYTHSEVIRWKENAPHNDNKKFKLPGRKEAISLACGEAAKNYSKRIVPYWAESTRVLVGLNGMEWDKALLLAKNNKWDNAVKIWRKYTESTQTKAAGVAALDFAVAQEMAGDLEKATFWSEKSVSLLRNGETGRIARNYAAILYQRKLKADRLNVLLKPSRP